MLQHNIVNQNEILELDDHIESVQINPNILLTYHQKIYTLSPNRLDTKIVNKIYLNIFQKNKFNDFLFHNSNIGIMISKTEISQMTQIAKI